MDKVINIELSEDEIVRRLSTRRVCENCGMIYRGDYKKPGNANNNGNCEKCGGKLKKRSDDDVNVILNRLKVYERETKPLVNYYSKEGFLVNIDGNGDEDEITKRIIESL